MRVILRFSPTIQYSTYQQQLVTCPNPQFISHTERFICSFAQYSVLSIWTALFFHAIAFSNIVSKNKNRMIFHYLFFFLNIIHIQILHKYDFYNKRFLPMMSIYVSLRIKRLLTNIAGLSISKLLLSFHFNSRNIINIRG